MRELDVPQEPLLLPVLGVRERVKGGGGVKPYYERGGITIYHGKCEDVLPTLEAGSVDLVLTDPPYGVNKAEWDQSFPTDWMHEASRVSRKAIAVMPGVDNILRLPFSVGEHVYRWTLSVHLTNGMARGRMGFGNWIPVVVYAKPDVSLHRHQQDAGAVAVVGAMPDHPSPKPLRAMTWVLSRFDVGSVLDPFMGSGTTLRAAMDLGMSAIGCEIEERYCEIAARRLQQQVLPLGEAA